MEHIGVLLDDPYTVSHKFIAMSPPLSAEGAAKLLYEGTGKNSALPFRFPIDNIASLEPQGGQRLGRIPIIAGFTCVRNCIY